MGECLFCDIQIEHKSLTLGEVLDGDRMALSQYELNFKGENFEECVCIFLLSILLTFTSVNLLCYALIV